MAYFLMCLTPLSFSTINIAILACNLQCLMQSCGTPLLVIHFNAYFCAIIFPLKLASMLSKLLDSTPSTSLKEVLLDNDTVTKNNFDRYFLL